MTHIYFMRLDAHNIKEIPPQLLALVGEERREHTDCIASPMGRALCLYAEILLRGVALPEFFCGNAAHCINRFAPDEKFDPICAPIVLGEHGKPYMPDFPDFHFNWSHSKDALVLAASGSPVGVDMEKLRPARDGVAKRYFTEGEIAYVFGGSNGSHDRRFFETWTKKEAYVKYTGSGLSVPLDSFDVTGEKLREKLKTFVHGNYIISLCGDEKKYDFTEEFL
ncbi:MAG: 4'-phosphopantetheinyl transferase superfamily protein [Clostridiales bacterium]|nr:4'-phosphopantetheinyl transferase superfamily protein [Clostridiales bacterium]